MSSIFSKLKDAGPFGSGWWSGRNPASPIAPFVSGQNFPGYGPEPEAPSYVQGYNPATQSLAGEMDQRLNQIQLNTQGLDKFRGEALREGPSKWANLQTERMKLEERDARGRALGEMTGQTAAARSQLAMRGGLSSGARERLAKSGMNNYLQASQNIGSQAAKNLLDLQAKDESNRIAQLGSLPGMEVQALQPALEKTKMYGSTRQFDVDQATREIERRNAFNANRYNQQMQSWAANNAANYQAWAAKNTGGLFGKGGFLGLGSVN